MDRRQSPRVSSGSSGQRVTDDGAVHGSPPAFPQVQPTSEDLRCRPMPNQPTTNYPAGHPPAAGIPYDSLHWAVQGEYTVPQGFTLPYLPPSVTQFTSYGSGGVHNTADMFADRQGFNSNVSPNPHSVVGPDGRAPPAVVPSEGRGQYSGVDMYRHGHRNPHERPDLRRPVPNYTQHSNGNALSHGPHSSLSGYTSMSGGVPRENRFPAIARNVLPDPPPTHISYPRMQPRPTMVHTSPTPRRPSVEAQSRRRNPHDGARVYRTQQELDISPTSAGPSRERAYVPPEHLGSSGPHSYNNRGVGHPAELPPNPHSDGLPNRSTGIPGHRSSSTPKHTSVGLNSASGQHRTHTTGSERLARPTAARLPGSSATPRSIRAIKQTLYTCKTNQDWTQQPPIEFGAVKLTDAENPGYLGIPDSDQRALNYPGVGSSISSRLIFSNGEIGKWKILTTNSKRNREYITKKKLASEIAKFVKRHVERIKKETGRDDITFDNIVLTRLIHVSKASWQPELSYEVPFRSPTTL